ncbi:hypothetical protein, partial [Alistipes putredinis]|uniref:hypothetical protein n=1 Tax=Alistipes putredinis TaxID=28117 RepID=UPI003A947378
LCGTHNRKAFRHARFSETAKRKIGFSARYLKYSESRKRRRETSRTKFGTEFEIYALESKVDKQQGFFIYLSLG